MAEVAFLHYRPGNSLLHRLPGWIKLIMILIFSLAVGRAGFILLGVSTLLLLAASFAVKPAFRKMGIALIFALVMGGLLLWSDLRMGSSPGEASIRGARFILMFWAAIVFTACTHPAELGEAFYQITRFIPFVPARRLQTHITLTLTFFPLIMDESATVDRAARSRCFHRRKNPLIRLRYRVEPLIDGVFRKSDEISRAMAARCYGEEEK
ncbi:MAG: energy-coupling factor transporter transmembrane component T [Spirochaetales bacterium]|nr:energy-coupling factor transporter transmembrane component T [Spirochaetales bacterium]